MNLSRFVRLLPMLALLTAPACEPAADEPDPTAPDSAGAETGDLPLGDYDAPELKGDGWGAALDCKVAPDLPRLGAPRIFVSLDGLTLRLVDADTDFEKVFPIGAGAIDTKESSRTYGESLSYYPLASQRRDTFEITPSSIQPCKVWWTDSATGRRLPVFAGLPFLSWSGNYGIHGPIDRYTEPNGGTLRRGFVSHGCLRMEAADILEVYARIRGVAHVPVHVQREPERRADGSRVDVGEPWIGTECVEDGDCDFDGGECKLNAFSGRGFCTMRCLRSCPDRANRPVTFCVADPDDAGRGICVNQVDATIAGCRPYEQLVPRRLARFGDPRRIAEVCVPGSRGFTGDGCRADGDCLEGHRCEIGDGAERGQCTQDCARYCGDLPGYPTTLCAADPDDGAGACRRTCSPESNAPECGADAECVPRARRGQPDRVEDVCVAR